jgi:hypothetical protein
VCGDRSVIDDSPATRCLAFHQAERFLRAEKHARQIHINHALPVFEGHVFERHTRGAHSGIVEKNIEASEGLIGFCKEMMDGSGIRHIRRDDQGF